MITLRPLFPAAAALVLAGCASGPLVQGGAVPQAMPPGQPIAAGQKCDV